MPGTPATTEYCYDLDGLSFTISAETGDDGIVRLTLTVLEGSADFNAIYWGDDDQSGDSATLATKSLNMNGVDQQWDGALKLSDPGLRGGDKETYVTEGESLTFELPAGVTLDDLGTIGVRATSTSTPEGSIKAVADCVDHDDDDDDDDDDPDDFPEDAYKVRYHYDSDGDGVIDQEAFITDWGDEPPPETFEEYVTAGRELVVEYRPDLDPNEVLVGMTVFDADLNQYYYEITPEDAPLDTAAPESGEDFMAALSTGELDEDAPFPDEAEELDTVA